MGGLRDAGQRALRLSLYVAALLVTGCAGDSGPTVELDPALRLLRDDLPPSGDDGQALQSLAVWGRTAWATDLPWVVGEVPYRPRQGAGPLMGSATVSLRLDPSARRLEGRADMVVRAENATVSRLSFSLSAAEVEVTCLPADCTFAFSGELLTLTPAVAIEPGQSLALQLTWSDTDVERVVDFTPEGGGQVLANLVSAESTFFVFGYFFWPIPRELIGGAEITFLVNHPGGQTLLMSGNLISTVPEADGRQTTSWQVPWRSNRGVALVLGAYQKVTGRCGGSELEIYALPGNSGDGYPIRPESYLPVLEELCTSFTARFGHPPSPVIRLAGVDERFTNGYSSPGLVVVPNYTFDDDGTGSFAERDFFLAHELSHQWWGLGVWLASIADLWLVEGMADYVSLTSLEMLRGPETGRYLWLWEVRPLIEFFAAGGKDHPLLIPAGEAIEYRIPYIKGAWVLRMLEDAAGQVALEKALARAARDYLGRPFASVDLEQLVEAEAGEDLGWFFEQWLNGTGLISLQEEHTVAGGRLELSIVQRRPWSADPPRYFRAPLTVRVREDERWYDFPLQIDDQSNTFSLELPP